MGRYASTEELHGWIEIPPDGVDDDELVICLTASENAVDAYAGWRFDTAAAEQRFFMVPDSCYDSATVDPFIAGSITAFDVDTTGDGTYDEDWTAETVEYHPVNGTMGGITGWPHTAILPIDDSAWPRRQRNHQIRITADWGWSAVPEDVKLATLILASRLHSRRKSREGVAGFEGAGVVRLDRGEDRDVAMLLMPYSNPARGI